MNIITEKLRDLFADKDALAKKRLEIKNKALEKREAAGVEQAKNEIRELDSQIEKIVKEIKEINEIEGRTKNMINNILNYKDGMEREGVLQTGEYRSAWLKSLQKKNLDDVETRALTSASDSAGAVIPTQTMDRFIEKLEQDSVLYKYIDVTNIPGNVSYPAEDSTSDANWVEESTASVDGDDKLKSINLSAFKLIKTITITAKVEAMSINAFEKWLVNRLVRKMKKAIENAIINGNGVNKPTGVLSGVTWVKTTGDTQNHIEVSAAGTINYDNIVDLISLLPSSYSQYGVFVANRKFIYGVIAKIKTTDGKPLIPQNLEGGFSGKIMGYPVIVNDYMPENTMLFGDYSYYTMNWAADIKIEFDKSVGFKSGDTVYRAMGLCDGKPLTGDAFVKLTKAVA
jgi:HK97 family phage major capsid protein